MRRRLVAGICLPSVALLLGGALVLTCWLAGWPVGIFGRPQSTSNVCGVYVADDDIAHEVLTLRPDGTYTQRVKVKETAEEVVSEGKWVYRRLKGYVTFLDGFMLLREFPHKLKPDYGRPFQGIVSKPAQYWFGYLLLGSSESIEYRKVKSRVGTADGPR